MSFEDDKFAAQKQLAIEQLKRRQAAAAKDPAVGIEQLPWDISAGIARSFVIPILGVPQDVGNWLFTSFGADEPPMMGTDGLIALANRVNLMEEPVTAIGGRTGNAIGAAMSFFLPISAAARAGNIVKQSMPMVSRLPTAVSGGRTRQLLHRGKEIVQGVGRPVTSPVTEFATKPGRTLAFEGSAAASAGLAAGITEEAFPEETKLQAAAEIAGGMMNPAQRLRNMWQMGNAGVARSIRFVTKRGATERAAEGIRRAGGDQFPAAKRDIATPVEGVVPGARLTPAQELESIPYLSLERDIIASNAAASGQYYDMQRLTLEAMKHQAKGVAGDVPPSAAADWLEQQQAYMLSLLDGRMDVAVRDVARHIDNLKIPRTREDVNIAARAFGEEAMRATRKQEKQLWEAVDSTLLVPTDKTRLAYAKILDNMAEGGEDVLPDFVYEHMKRHKYRETVKDLYTGFGAFRKKIGKAIRIGRGEQDYDRVNALQRIDDALIEDAEVIPDNTLQLARQFSKDKNDRFTRGAWGKILGYRRDGSARTQVEATLEGLINGRPTGTANARELLESFTPTMGAGQASGVSPELRQQFAETMQDHLRSQFVFSSFNESTQALSRERAQNYLRDNAGVLENFPNLRRQMQDAVDSRTRADEVIKQSGIERTNIIDRRKSAAAAYLGVKPGKEINNVLSSRSPTERLKEIVDEMRKDGSETALGGLKNAFVQEFFGKNVMDAVVEGGKPVLNGRALSDRWAVIRPIVEKATLFDADELRRLDEIVNTARKTSLTAPKGKSIGDLLDAAPDRMTDLLLRWSGAQAGGASSLGKSSGTSLVMAGQTSRIFREAMQAAPLTRSADIMAEAVVNRDLFQALTETVAEPHMAEALAQRLNAYMIDLIPLNEIQQMTEGEQ